MPHLAKYTIALRKNGDTGDIDNVFGTMTIGYRNEADRITFNRDIKLNINYKDGFMERLVCNLSSWESLDGKRSRYSLNVTSSDPIEKLSKTGEIIIFDKYVESICDGYIQTKYTIPKTKDCLLSIHARKIWISEALKRKSPYFKTQRVFTGEFDVPPVTSVTAFEVCGFKANYSKEMLGSRVVKIVLCEFDENSQNDEDPSQIVEYYSSKGVGLKLEIPFDGLILDANLIRVEVYDYSVL